MDWAVIAAFTAAGISLINVAITLRATSKASHEQWRRSEVQPVAVRILALSDQATREQCRAILLHRSLHDLGAREPVEEEQALKLRAEEKDHWSTSTDARQKLSLEVAQLQLVAHEPVRKAAVNLRTAQRRMELPHMGPRARFLDDPLAAWGVALPGVKVAEDALIDAARADLGIYQG